MLLIIVLLQIGYFFFLNFPQNASPDSLVVDQELQSQIDRLKKAALEKDSVKIYPFNPNFITDYKGYVLGMSSDEIDRLHAFRKQKKFANTPEEFQKVTQVSDSLLDAISPYFKFPEWTQKRNKRSPVVDRPYSGNEKPLSEDNRRGSSSSPLAPEGYLRETDTRTGETSDLNAATAEDLRQIYGIGEKLSARIVKFRDRLGGFLVDEQLYDVYGLEPDVVDRTFKKFRVLHPPEIQKININQATAEEIAKLVYIQKQVAERIVDYRNGNGGILSMDELKNIEDFPSDKISRIALYLSL